MDTLLITVTLASLLLALTMSAIAWKLMREKRARRAARVEALEALAFSAESTAYVDAAGSDEDDEAPYIAAPAMPAEALPPSSAARTRTVEPARPIEPAASDDEDNWDLALHRKATPSTSFDDQDTFAMRSARERHASAEPMFEGAAAHGAVMRRWMAVAAVALVMAACIATAYALKSPEVVAAVEATRREASGANRGGPQPLELLSLKHTQNPDGSFTVTGLVQNPLDGAAQNGIIVVVYLFDDGGRYFAGGRSTLDAGVAQPGGESSFTVRVPDAGTVVRYRVGFRHDDNTVVEHVDRRGQAPAGTTGDTVAPPDDEPAPEPTLNPISARRREG